MNTKQKYTSKFTYYKLIVNWGDCDPAGIVFYPNFYKWFDESHWFYFKKLGIPIPDLKVKYGIVGLPLVDTGAKFLVPCAQDKELTVKTSIEKITHKTFTFKHEILLEQTIAVSGYEVRIWASKDNSGKLITSNIPYEILKIIKS